MKVGEVPRLEVEEGLYSFEGVVVLHHKVIGGGVKLVRSLFEGG